MNSLKLKLKRIRPEAILPTYGTEFSACMDLSACIEEPVVLQPMERKLIPTGWAMEIPADYEVQLRPRSGISYKLGLTLINCIATIDEDFKGEVFVSIVNLSKEVQIINPKDRIAQMLLSPIERFKVSEIEELSDTARGTGGFGSTDKVLYNGR